MLINCPECGKEISDKANTCIYCGYPINSNAFYQVSLISCGENKVKVIKLIRQIMSLGLKESADIANMLPYVMAAGLTYDDARYIETLLVQRGAIAVISQDNESTIRNDIRNKMSEFDKQIERVDNSNKPCCPYCSSTDLKKISGFSKAGSVALFGIFSVGKVGKQWHCNNCKSDF